MQFVPKHPVPVFPLPGIVLFPGVRLPLHVFELRYRTMVREALSGERVLALALARPGREGDAHGGPEFHPLGCLARIDTVAWLPNDCYNLQVLGLARARLGRAVREFPYRAVQVQVQRQDPLTEDDPLVQIERHALIEAGTRLENAQRGASESPVAGAGSLVPVDDLNFEALVNRLCMGLGLEPADQMALLEIDSLIDRGRRARELMEDRLRWAGRGGGVGGEHN